MLDINHTSESVSQESRNCLVCGHALPSDNRRCPYCGETTRELFPVKTRDLERIPSGLRASSARNNVLEPTASVLLQMLPSGSCIALRLKDTVILGRIPGGAKLPNVVDLTDYNADFHGVSRQHCLLRRQDNHLIVTELNSTNGTYLNEMPLLPNKDYEVGDGDQLILGTLHITVFFTPSAAA